MTDAPGDDDGDATGHDRLRAAGRDAHTLGDYARHLAAEARRAGRGDVEVRADVYVALNGRPSRRFVDPAKDLTRLTRAPVVPR